MLICPYIFILGLKRILVEYELLIIPIWWSLLTCDIWLLRLVHAVSLNAFLYFFLLLKQKSIRIVIRLDGVIERVGH